MELYYRPTRTDPEAWSLGTGRIFTLVFGTAYLQEQGYSAEDAILYMQVVKEKWLDGAEKSLTALMYRV